MPLVTVFSSAEAPPEDKARALLTGLSAAIARVLGKPEKYVMTCLLPRTSMTFGGSFEPACCVAVRSIGALTKESAARLSAATCKLIHDTLGVPTDRVYVVCDDVPATLWGWDGSTFG
jgi:phenylpyruvate tautomerase PptA (4-oxalocrotonate tautomerase family)